jgi:glycerol uptake facilitator-like aquaporin
VALDRSRQGPLGLVAALQFLTGYVLNRARRFGRRALIALTTIPLPFDVMICSERIIN